MQKLSAVYLVHLAYIAMPGIVNDISFVAYNISIVTDISQSHYLVLRSQSNYAPGTYCILKWVACN